MPLVIGLGIGLCEGSGSGAPTLGIDLSAGALPASVTFTRGSSGTYFNSAGLLATATSNVARFGFHPTTLAPLGLLVEGSRTNLLVGSRDFANGETWVNSNCSVNDDIGTLRLDGTSGALLLLPDEGRDHCTLEQAYLNGNTTAATLSVCARLPAGGLLALISLYIDEGVGVNTATVTFNLALGTISSAAAVTGVWTAPTASIEPLNNGWFRLHLRCTPGTTASARAVLGMPEVGDGVSGVAIDYAQCEAAAFASSVIVTTVAQVTRSADLAIITGTPATTAINNTEGTLLAEYTFEGGSSAFGAASARLSMSIDDGTVNEIHAILDVANACGATTIDGGVAQSSMSVAGTVAVSTVVKVAYAYKLNDMRGAKNGTLMTADVGGTMPTCTRIGIGSTTVSGSHLFGHVKRVAYWNIRQLDARLQTLTT